MKNIVEGLKELPSRMGFKAESYGNKGYYYVDIRTAIRVVLRQNFKLSMSEIVTVEEEAFGLKQDRTLVLRSLTRYTENRNPVREERRDRFRRHAEEVLNDFI